MHHGMDALGWSYDTTSAWQTMQDEPLSIGVHNHRLKVCCTRHGSTSRPGNATEGQCLVCPKMPNPSRTAYNQPLCPCCSLEQTRKVHDKVMFRVCLPRNRQVLISNESTVPFSRHATHPVGLQVATGQGLMMQSRTRMRAAQLLSANAQNAQLDAWWQLSPKLHLSAQPLHKGSDLFLPVPWHVNSIDE